MLGVRIWGICFPKLTVHTRYTVKWILVLFSGMEITILTVSQSLKHNEWVSTSSKNTREPELNSPSEGNVLLLFSLLVWAFYWCNLVFISALCEVVCSVFLLRVALWMNFVNIALTLTFLPRGSRHIQHFFPQETSWLTARALKPQQEEGYEPYHSREYVTCVYLCVFVKRLHRGCICSRGSNGTGIKVSHLSLPACLEACTVLDSVWE